MIKKVVTYTGIDGEEKTETLYFHLGIDQITTLEERHPEGIVKFFQTIVDGENATQTLVKLREIMTLAHGFREEGSDDFVRDEERTRRFMNSLAYDALWVSLIGDPKAQEEFMGGILPSGMAAKAEAEIARRGNLAAVPDVPKPWITENRDPTPAEVRTMSKEDLVEAFKLRTQIKPGEDHQ